MVKVKYRFNPESLSFDKVRTSFRVLIVKLFTFFTASIVISIIYYIIFSHYFNSPKEKALLRVNDQMKFKYELVQKQLGEINKVLDDIQKRDDNIYRTIFEADPIPKSVREAGFGGVNRYETLEKETNSQIVVETVKRLDIISKRLYVQSKSYDEVIEKALNKEQMLSCMPAIQPVANKGLERTSSGWGWRIHPLYKIRQFHFGQDFAAPVGTEIYATADGIVEKLESSKYSGYGNCIVIDHGFGYKTRFAHLSEFNVKLGQKVKRGNIIGFVGSTGFSTGPHLHYEIEKNGEKVNPVNFFFNDLSAQQFDEIIALSNIAGQTLD